MFHPNEDLTDRWTRLLQDVKTSRPGEDAAQQFIRVFKDYLRPDLVDKVPDALFQLGREKELGQRVEAILDARLAKDKVPIGRQLRLRLIESLLADIERGGRERFGEK